MNVQPVGSAGQPPHWEDRAARPGAQASFGDVLAAAVDGASAAVEQADARAGEIAAGSGNVVAASVARAKADVVLEIVSVAASRISGAINSLLQTQV